MATVKHRNSDAIWLFDYPVLAAQDDCPELQVWLSMRDIQIILTGLSNIDKFRSRVFYSVQGDVYEKVTPLDFETFQGWVSDLFNHIGGYIMCNELLEQQNLLFEQMVAQLARLADCNCSQTPTVGGTGGSRGSGTSPTYPNPYDEGQTPEVPPPGFPDMATYRTHKCNASAQIVRELGEDMQSISLMSLVGVGSTALAAALAVTLLTPVPFDELLVIATAVIVGAVQASWLAQVSTLVDANFDDLVCEIYNAANATAARTALIAAINTLIDGDGNIPAIGKPYVKQAVGAIVSTDSVNRAFTDVPVSEVHDCSSCGPDEWWNCAYGEVLEMTVDTVELGSVLDLYGGYLVLLTFNAKEDVTTSLQNGAMNPHPVSPECMTTIFDNNASCQRTCGSGNAGQWPTGQFGTFNQIYTVMYRSSTPFSVLFELV